MPDWEDAARCPICRKPLAPEDAASRPFCSQRCRLIDLGRWLGEEYRIPAEPDRPDEEDEPGDQ